MKTLKSPHYAFILLMVMCLLNSEAVAQKNNLPPGLSRDSTVPEVLEYLNNTLFPYARILMNSGVLEDEMEFEVGVGYYTPHRLLIFSQGFKLASGADDCHITLRNDDVIVYDAESNLSPIDLTPRTKTGPPYVAEFSVWLETVSYDKGKPSFYLNKNPLKNKLFGPWRTEFQSRGFFSRSIFGLRVPALKRNRADEYRTSESVMFIFDDKMMRERFDMAFRRLIKLCQPRSTNPRWSS